MIIATIITLSILFFGGGGGNLLPKDFNKRVKAEVTDKEQRKEVNAIAKQMNKDFAEYQKKVEAFAKDELALNSNHDVERQEFEALLDDVLRSREETQAKLLDGRFKMIDHFTEEQWNAVFAEDDS